MNQVNSKGSENELSSICETRIDQMNDTFPKLDSDMLGLQACEPVLEADRQKGEELQTGTEAAHREGEILTITHRPTGKLVGRLS